MSTAAVATRPSQALRQRRESQRPGFVKTSTGKPSAMEDGTTPREEPRPYVVTQEYILKKFKGREPSLKVYLHPSHFKVGFSQEPMSYSSPMKELLEHIRAKTVPHNMLEEFYQAGIPFYDNCLIVEIHDLKSAGTPQNNANAQAGGTETIPGSIHKYSSFLTPSPYVPYPTTPKADQKAKAAPVGADGAVKTDIDAEKENMPAPGVPTPQKKATKERVFTVVLFPTAQSQHVDVMMLANTELPDVQTYRRNQAASRTASTPTMAHPPTPLTSVPPTPSTANSRSPKRRRMVLDEFNRHEFEAAVINATAPPLYLEPTAGLEESVALIDAMTPAEYKNPRPARKSRKRTTAELAADEAEAAEMQRFMLAGDEWQASKTANVSAGDENQNRGANFQTFSRFKTLESIKMHHEEDALRKKEEEAKLAQQKRQAQAVAAEAEAQKRKDMERQSEQRALLQHRQELLHQQQQQQQQQQQEALRAASQAQMANAQAQQQFNMAQSQPQHSSPVIRQQTPMAGSPIVNSHTPHPMGGVPMANTSSSHGAGSPPRPASVASHHPGVPMARNMSQQQAGQNVSRNGTPQMVQGTPIMNSAMPARNMTPQPRMGSQGSPNIGMQGTPMLGQTPQPNGLTPEQMQAFRHRQQQQQLARMAAQGMHSVGGTPTGMNAEQVASVRAQQQIQQHGIPHGQDAQVYQQMLARQILAQQQQQRNQMSPQGQQQMRAMQQGNLATMDSQSIRLRQQQMRQRLAQQFGQNIPQQHMQQLRQFEVAARAAEAREAHQGQVGGQQGAGNNQGMQGMQGMQGINMGGQQNPQAAVQYQQMLQRQQAQRAAQQQQQQMMAQMRQQGMQGGMQGMNMNNINMVNAGMQGMQGNMNMAGMNMGGMGGGNQMTMQQVQQMQQMQQMQRMQQMQMAQARGRGQGEGGNIDWNGV